MSKIRTVVLGLGRSGWRHHCGSIAPHPRFELAGVVDAVPDRLQEAREQYGCETDTDAARLIARLRPELVVVALPSHLHGPMSIMALEAGCHVLVEKPMAVSAAEARRMIDVARRTGRVLTVFQSARVRPAFVKLQEVMADGRIGTPVLVKMRSQTYLRRRDWQMLLSRGGGMLPNTGAHFVDQALLLLGGAPEQLFCDMRHTVSAGDADDHLKLLMRRGNLTVDIELTQIATFKDEASTVVYGTCGGIQVKGDTMTIRWFDPKSVPEPVLYDGPAVNRSYDKPEDLPWQEEVVQLPGGKTEPLFYDRLAATLRDGAPLFVTPEQVLIQMEVFDECRRLNGFPVAEGAAVGGV